jgi:4-cresol dehydrogenase (hydroxylating)
VSPVANLARALEAWREILGPEHVLTDAATLSSAETATFLTTQSVPAVIRPGSREEVQECVRVANEHKAPIYPVSTGKNWAYGSRVPPQDGSVLMELHRLARIVDYDERLAYVAVEPGVTFAQLHEFLRAQGSRLMVSVTGSTPDSSLVGNALERGAGSGPYYDRFAHVCNFEVVLPTGECVNTGFGRFPGSETANLHRWGVGPYLDGIFTQSNLGVVTRMTVWLAPLPDYFQSCFFGLEEEEGLEGLIDALQLLQLRGLFRAGLTVRNDFNVFTRMQQYPWEALEGRTPMPEELLENIRKSWWRNAWWGSRWIGWAEMYSGSREQGLAERKVIEGALKDKVDRLVFVDEGEVAISRWDTLADTETIASSFGSENPEESVSLGVPTEDNVFSTYWRKKTPAPESGMDPDRDGCGVIFNVPTIPYEGRHVRAALDLIKEALGRYEFEPILIIGCFTGRVIYLDAAIYYDREVPGEDERALACHDEMLGGLIRRGYVPYRLGIQSVKLLPEPKDDYGKLLGALKKALDPNNILAPGRYGL